MRITFLFGKVTRVSCEEWILLVRIKRQRIQIKVIDEAGLKEVCGKVVSVEGDFMSSWVSYREACRMTSSFHVYESSDRGSEADLGLGMMMVIGKTM